MLHAIEELQDKPKIWTKRCQSQHNRIRANTNPHPLRHLQTEILRLPLLALIGENAGYHIRKEIKQTIQTIITKTESGYQRMTEEYIA